jgi:hypothetical protein
MTPGTATCNSVAFPGLPTLTTGKTTFKMINFEPPLFKTVAEDLHLPERH